MTERTPLRVFLTGATSGLGEALARRYAKRGATLGLFARRQAELERLKREVAPATVATYAGDVRDAEALSAAGARVVYRELADLSHTYPREENARILEWFLEA